VGAWEAECPVLIERHVVERHRRTEMTREGGRVPRARQDVAGHAEALACHSGPAPEDAVRTPADVLGRDARQLAAGERQREHEVAVGALAWPLAEVDE